MTALLELMDEAETAGREVVLKGVTGVSIGAINAACIVGSHGRADARRRLKELWEDLRLDTPSFLPAQVQRDLAFFGLPGFCAPRMDVWALPGWKYLYDTSPLLATLERHVDFEALNASPTSFVVTAVDVVSGVLTRFRNHPHPHEGKDRAPPKRECDHVCEIGPRHILASGSLAPQFPWVEIGGASYWDGGLVDNTPLGDAIDAFSDDTGSQRLLVVMNLYRSAPACRRISPRFRTGSTSSPSATACARTMTARTASTTSSRRSASSPRSCPRGRSPAT